MNLTERGTETEVTETFLTVRESTTKTLNGKSNVFDEGIKIQKGIYSAVIVI